MPVEAIDTFVKAYKAAPPAQPVREIGQGPMAAGVPQPMTTGGIYAAVRPIDRERRRVQDLLPTPLHAGQLQPSMTYAKWNGGYLEINDTLLGRRICPADLLGVPCLFDEFRDGCRMIRLCRMVSKYTEHKCPDAGQRRADNIGKPANCGHVHWEVEISCRYVATQHIRPNRICKLTRVKEFTCACGHDFEKARQASRDRYYIHKEDAERAGARGLVKFGWEF